MKRILSIMLVIMVLASGLHMTVASHYCGGRLAQVKWSLNHDLAGCGMEGEGNRHSDAPEWQAACCHDQVALWGIDSHFDVSKPMLAHSVPHASSVWFVAIERSWANRPQLLSTIPVFPPGRTLPACVERSLICVYRI